MTVHPRTVGLLAIASAVVLPLPASANGERHPGQPRETAATSLGLSPQPANPRRTRHHRRHRHGAKKEPPAVQAVHAAHDPAVTIIDFSFSPASITINVGDTITWTNTGKAPHTATADNGNFDTGTLQKGQSGSHTFSQAGTFAYYCTIHPFMKATVVVHAPSSGSGSGSGSSSSSSGSGSGSSSSGSGSGSSSSGSSTGSTASSTPSSAASSSAGLPNTGMDAFAGLLLGGALLALGLGLRRRVLG